MARVKYQNIFEVLLAIGKSQAGPGTACASTTPCSIACPRVRPRSSRRAVAPVRHPYYSLKGAARLALSGSLVDVPDGAGVFAKLLTMLHHNRMSYLACWGHRC